MIKYDRVRQSFGGLTYPPLYSWRVKFFTKLLEGVEEVLFKLKFSVIFLSILVFLVGGAAMAMEIKSSAFTDNTEIPRKYTCQGEDISPPLSWNNVPAGTKSLVLINDDPDAPAGTWVHWVIFNIPADKKGLEEGEGAAAEKQLSDGSKQGMTDFGRVGYGGPCPPPGKYHRYFFKLYALDALLNLAPGATKGEVERAMEGYVLVKAEMIGRYKR